MSATNQTQDHETIKKWAEARGGVPAKVKGTGSDDNEGVIRIHFPKHSDSDNLVEISWDDFFKDFEDNNLDFLYQDKKTDGETSTFHKLVARDGAKQNGTPKPDGAELG